MPSQVSRDRTGLLDIKDDDPSLHPPVASLPRQQDDEDAEKEAYRLPRLTRQTSPVSSRRAVDATAGSNASNQCPQEPELHRRANLDPRPGAIPMNGRAAGQAPDWARPQPESPPRQPIRQHQGRVLSDFNLRFYRTNSSSIQNADIAEANAIDDAEAVVYATSVNADRTAKNRRIAVGLGILAVVIIVGLSVGLTYEVTNPNGDKGIDPWCLLPPDKQHVFARCLCSGNNTTDGLNLLTANETKFYSDLKKLLLNVGVIAENYTIDSCELQNQCIVWSSNYLKRNLTEEIARIAFNATKPVIQAHVLCMTYLQLDGRHWQENDGWLTEGYYCDWFGVSCSFLSRITAIELPSNVLNGTFPSLLHHMPYLRELDLSRNPAMKGTIPSELSILSSLRRLDLSHADMTGAIPEEIEGFEILDRLILSNNSFSGTIPINMTKLRARQLYLDGNKLNGSLPTEFGNLASLELLYLDDNLLNGTVPSELGNLNRIVELSLSNNKFSGTLCTDLGLFRNLEILRVDSNRFNGNISKDFAPLDNRALDDKRQRQTGWKYLQELNLSNNSFTGTFPEFLGDLPHLVSVAIHGTQLTGRIPDSFCTSGKVDKAAIILDCNKSKVEVCDCCEEDEVTFCADSLPPGLEDLLRSRF
jgi:Leucine-rich repeat (LRR) protein